MSNYKTVFFTLGLLQIILGLSMIIPVLAQILYNETDAGFIGSGLISIVFGMLFFLSNLDHDKKINLQQAFVLTSLIMVKYCCLWFTTIYIFKIRFKHNRCFL